MTSFGRDKMLFTSTQLYYGNTAPGAQSSVKHRLAVFAKIKCKIKWEAKQFPNEFDA